jgi:hypothetical protein
MDLAMVFYLPQPGGRIQAGKLVSPGKDPHSGGELVQAFTTKFAPEHQVIH